MSELSFKTEVFEGPLDLLLHLISKNKVSICDIPISMITDQYFAYIELMQQIDMEVGGEFLVMASQLLLIKSRLLLPKAEDEPEDDPRKDLTWALLEYQTCKQNAEALSKLKATAGETFVKKPDKIDFPKKYRENMPVSAIRNAYIRVLQRNSRRMPPKVDSFAAFVQREIYPVTDKLREVVTWLKKRVKLDFVSLFSKVRTRSEIVATFLAVLELVSDKKIRVNEGKDMNYEIEAVKE